MKIIKIIKFGAFILPLLIAQNSFAGDKMHIVTDAQGQKQSIPWWNELGNCTGIIIAIHEALDDDASETSKSLFKTAETMGAWAVKRLKIDQKLTEEQAGEKLLGASDAALAGFIEEKNALKTEDEIGAFFNSELKTCTTLATQYRKAFPKDVK